MKRLVCLLAFAVISIGLVTSASAQQSGPQPLDGPADSFGFFPRYDFQLEANILSGDNGKEFRWDTHFGGEFDVMNYVKGRATVVTDYEAVLGSELRPFDPNQGNYILEPAFSWFVGKNELSFVFHHVSRHLSDRPKTYAIAMNEIEGRYLRKFEVAPHTSVSVRVGGGKLVQHSQVDYTWGMDWDIMAKHAMNPHVEIYGRTNGEMFAIDPLIRLTPDRGAQHTTRVEVGTRINGTKADLELFLGAEHRLDASPVDFIPVSWAIAGFRIASK